MSVDIMDMSDLVGSIRRGNLEDVKARTAEMVDMDAQVDGMTLLFIAVFKQQLEVVEYLLARGASATVRNEEGAETPLILARRRNDVELIRLLTTRKDKLVSGMAGMNALVGFDAALESPAVPVSASLDAIPLRASVSMVECSICFCDDESLVRLERCGHGCCPSCLADFLKTRIDDQIAGGANPVIRCFARGCTESVSFRDVERFAPLPSVQKYGSRLTDAALRLMSDFHWCTKCEFGGIVLGGSSGSCTDATCLACDHAFCSLCREDAHSGITCAQKHEQVMLTDHFHTEKLTAKELRRTCKTCPQCAALTMRDGGCSHMTCKSCSFAWCWFCGGPYIGRYTFNNNCPCGPRDV